MGDQPGVDRKIRVLIIEDDHFLSSIVKSRLERDGMFIVGQAFDGEEGLRLVSEFKPDIIILDLIMPKLSGFELLERLSSDPEFNQIPVLIASNLGQESDIEKAKSLGAVDYYVKVRTSIDDLDKMIKNVVAQRFNLQLMPRTDAGQAQTPAVQEPPAEEPPQSAPSPPQEPSQQ